MATLYLRAGSSYGYIVPGVRDPLMATLYLACGVLLLLHCTFVRGPLMATLYLRAGSSYGYTVPSCGVLLWLHCTWRKGFNYGYTVPGVRGSTMDTLYLACGVLSPRFVTRGEDRGAVLPTA